MSMCSKYSQFEISLTNWCKNWGPKLLILTFSVIFFWFGMLKIFGVSAVEELVENATDWIFPHQFGTFLGFWEVAIALLLPFQRVRRFGILLLLLQFPGTFLPLVTNPESCFTGVPFGLTLEGKYVFKNMILIAGALVITGTLNTSKPCEKKPTDPQP